MRVSKRESIKRGAAEPGRRLSFGDDAAYAYGRHLRCLPSPPNKIIGQAITLIFAISGHHAFLFTAVASFHYYARMPAIYFFRCQRQVDCRGDFHGRCQWQI